VNTATITAVDQCDENDANDSASVTVTPQLIDLSVTKRVDRTNPVAGEDVAWIMTVRNDGPAPATGVSLVDRLPSGVTFLRANANKGTYASGNGSWTVGALAVGEEVTLTIVTRVDSTALQLNTVEVTAADQIDVDSIPNNGAVEDDLATAAVVAQERLIDLAVTKTVDRTSPVVGEDVLWTMTVRNEGAHTATGVTLRDVLPSGVTYVSSSVAKGSFDPGTGVWNVGNLVPTEVVALTITTRVNSTSPQVNAIEVITANERDIDSTPNNGAEEDDRATAAVVARERVIDLDVTKTVDRTVPTVGETVLFTMVVSNSGPFTATGVSLRDQLPSGLTYVSSSVAKGTFNPLTGIWDVGQLIPTERVALTITARVDAAVPITNQIEIFTAGERDIDSTPNNGLLEDDLATATIFPLGPRPQGDPDPTFSKRLFLAR
jgi:uncharacterized repeat protein (TIGR01451 family)